MKTRFEAYRTALDAHFMQPDEVRYAEDMPPLGFNWIKLGLQDVLYDPETKTIYTPNTNKTATMGEMSLSDGLPDDDEGEPDSELRAKRYIQLPSGKMNGSLPSNSKNNLTSSSGSGNLQSLKNSSAKGANKFKKGFSKVNLDRHWNGSSSHKAQYPNMSKADYAKRAKSLIEMPVKGDISGYMNSKGEIIRYDRKNNDFVKGHPTKGIKTMFKPSAGEKYYNKQEKGNK